MLTKADQIRNIDTPQMQNTYVMQRYLFNNISSGIYSYNKYQIE